MRQSVLAAAFDELTENGVGSASVASVARRSGVHETTIYRRWVTRENLFVDALLARSAEAIPAPDTGSIRGDLVELIKSAIAYLTSAAGAAILHTALLPVENDYAQARAAFWSARRDAVRPVLQRAIDRGELRSDIDGQVLLETLVGPIYTRRLLTGEPVDDELPQRIVDLVLDGALARHPD